MKAAAARWCVLIPCFNEEAAIQSVVASVLALGAPVIVIDDGSDDRTPDIVGALPVTLLRQDVRSGKGAALRRGFREALRQGYDAVLTMDGDGQHVASDIPRLLAAAARYPGHIVIGARLLDREQQPKGRRRANAVADWGISWACAQPIVDTQSGQRWYPRAALDLVDLKAENFVFEAAILIAASRERRLGVVSVPIASRYHGKFRPSHFRPVRDVTRISTYTIGRIFHHGKIVASYRRARGAPIVVDGPAVVTATDHATTGAPEPVPASTHDVVILGGGLAGLTLALQLRDAFPDLDVVVLERNTHPLPNAAHKVGESTVDVGAHYFGEVLGLRDYLLREHILKFGLRYFFSDGRSDIDQVTELGVSEVFPAPSYQLDRGIFENFLGAEVHRRGIDLREDTRVRGFDLGKGDGQHRVRCSGPEGDYQLDARWLVDASGRAGLLRRRLGLTADNGHRVNAAWFRIDDRLELDDWIDDPVWRARCKPPERWRSTNHLCGPGYWVWLIPLASGAHSVGIVADAAMHPLDTFNDFERALTWLEQHQPAVAREVAKRREKLLDFRFLKNYSHGCSKVFSADRWALTGEAGAFLDPFYSPGSDFIGIANTYICQLIAHDRAGTALASHVRLYERLYQSFYDSMLAIFRGQYPLFGNVRVMSAKIIWDHAFYWGVLCQLVFQRRLGDAALFADVGPQLAQAQQLNLRMQQLFRNWHAFAPPTNQPVMLDQRELPWFTALNVAMHDSLDDAGIRARLRDNVQLLHGLAASIVERAVADGGESLREGYADLVAAPGQPELFVTP